MLAEPLPLLSPVLATMAVICGARVHLARRRAAINRALHELRRPLQALALMPGSGVRRGSLVAPGSLQLALVALDDLDGAVNGSEPEMQRRPLPARGLVAAAIDRWRAPAARRQRSLSLEWRAGRAFVLADPIRVAQALDNLIANAVEHGGVGIRVEATLCAAGLRIAVADGGPASPARHRRGPQRGHGLEVVRRIARAHGGSFELGVGAEGTFAVLELPLAAAPLVSVPVDSAAWRPPRPTACRARPDGGAPAPPGLPPGEPASPGAA